MLPAEPPPATTARATRPDWDLRGTALEEWRIRAAAPETDQRGRVTLNGSAHHASDRFAATFAADFWIFPGGQPTGAVLPASSLSPATPGFDLLGLALDWRPGGVVRTVRGGRQETPIGAPATFDGLMVGGGPAGTPLDLYAFGGRSVYFFSILPEEAERWLVGAGASWRPITQLRVELDWRGTREERPSTERAGAASGAVTEQGCGLSLAWRPSDSLRARLAVRGLDARVAQVTAAVSTSLPLDLTLQAAGLIQPITLGDVSEASGVYFATLGWSQPFARASVELSGPLVLGPVTIDAHLGYRLRRLLEGYETPFNRNLSGAWLLLASERIGGTGLFATGTLERVGRTASLDEEGLWALGGSLGWVGASLWLDVGSRYQRYRYTYYAAAQELASVRTLHAEARWSLTRLLGLRLLYLHETADRTYQTITFGAAQGFE